MMEAQSPQVAKSAAVVTEAANKRSAPAAANSRRKSRFHLFGPATQIPFTWLLAIGCCVSFALTVFYAFSTSFLLRAAWVTTSPSNTILVIRALSAVTDLLMVGLVAGCFERAKWMLVASKNGSSLLGFLALSEGIGAVGLTTIIRARLRYITSTRLLAILRGIGLMIVPALSVVILSNVDVTRIYLSDSQFPVAGGIGDFKPEFADDNSTRLISGILFAGDFGSFLANPKLSVPVPPTNPSGSACINGGGGISGTCVSSYYVSGGLDSVTPWPVLNYSQPESSLYTMWRNPGYHFDFTALDDSARFNGASDCELYGGEDDAVLFCLAAGAEDALNMKWLSCPIETTTQSACLTDLSWQASTGFTNSLRAYRRTTTVHYHRSNLTIAAVADLSTPTPVTVKNLQIYLEYTRVRFKPRAY